MLAYLIPMTRAEARRLQAARDRFQRLTAELTPSGFISSGSVVRRFMTCGKPNCRCHADPPQLHGPYWQLNQVAGGRTSTRHLSEPQARLYQEWIANRRRLTKTLKEMERVSQRAAETLLEAADADAAAPALAHSTGSPVPKSHSQRATRALAEALVQASELLAPAAEAAQEWLEARAEQDRELIAEAQGSLDEALAEAPTLRDTMLHIARLLSTSAAATRPSASRSAAPRASSGAPPTG